MSFTPPSRQDLGDWLGDLWVALGFLTRLPLLPARRFEEGALAAAAWAFPLVGMVVGAVGGLVYLVASWLAIPPYPAALLAVAATALLTGALHEDGLADTVDGFGGGATPAEKLEIMRDSRSGAYGVLALVLSVSLRAGALAALAWNGWVVAALIAAHAVGRAGMAWGLLALEPARSDGLGHAAGQAEPAVVAIAAAIAAATALLGLGWRAGIVAVLAAALVTVLVTELARRQIGGHTGDVLGAIEQAGEITVLLVAAA